MQLTGALHKLSESSLTLANPNQDIRGRKVIDSDGEDLGKIEDLIVDEAEKKIRFLQVASGGFLGIREKKFLIPADAITRADREKVHIGATRSRVAGAPSYDPKLIDEQFLNDLYRYYGYYPFWKEGYIYPSFPFFY